ncbi:hypothetical protein CBR_g57143 [Chara braunii]|uniref:Uncharacterized protein n=1 Tax=Chara braunii TaxID=69332 RepID=A0A388ME58_CHABU|nr:hypothetical protein CBR_g57143 [Chara braunii]|eukprot:GBG92793.1 hypothetical protein CBR_g57143 [Chara braunii]
MGTMTVVRESMSVLLVSAIEESGCEAQWSALREEIKNCYGCLHRRHRARIDEIKNAVVILEPLVKDVFAQIRNRCDTIAEPSEKVFFAYHVQDVKDRIEHVKTALKEALVPYTWDELPASKPVSYRRRLVEAREELHHIRNGPLAALKAMMDEEETSGQSLSYHKSAQGSPHVAVSLPWPGALESPRGTVLGKEKCLSTLKEKLMGGSSSGGSTSAKLIGICGFGGVGKTTLARHVFEDQDIVKHFSGGRFWVGVTKNIPVLSVLNKLWAELLRESGTPASTFSSVDEAISNIQGRINCLRGCVLLALDDVWQESQIAPILDLMTLTLSCQLHILMTTRYSRIVQRGGAFWYEARPLDLDDAKKVICLHAFGEESPTLEHSLNKLVEGVCSECQGLPLALKIVGSSLQGKSASEWKVAYRNLRRAASITRRYHEAVFGSLSFSLDALHAEDPVLLDCFLDLAAYPEDYQIPVHELLLQWSTYDEVEDLEDALDLFMTLVDFSMVSWSNQSSEETVRDPENSWSSQWSKQSEGRVFLDLGHCSFLDDVLRDLALILSARKPYTDVKAIRLNATELMEQGVERPLHLLDRLFVAGGRCCSSNFVLANGMDAQLKHCVFHGWDRQTKAEEEVEMEMCVGNPTPRRQEARLAARNLSLIDGTFAEFSSNTAKCVSLKARNLQVLLAQGTRNEPCFLLEQLVRSAFGLRALNLHNCKTGKVPFDVTSLEASFASLQVCDMGSEFPDELISNWPVDFGRMEKLRYLDVRQNVVIGTSESEWLQEVCKLTSLTTLRMDSIRFEDNVIGDILPEIGNLHNLTALSASACGITSIPEEICCLSSLMFLDLSENELCDLPDSLGDLPSLTSLDLYKNPIRELPSTIGRLKKLQSFRVGGWGCSLSYFPRSMCQLTSLSTLWLGELEEEGEDSGEDFVSAASPGSQLRTREDMVYLLSHIPKLRFLNLTWPPMGGDMAHNDADTSVDGPLAAVTGFDNLEELILCQFPSTQPAFVPRCSRLVNLYLEGGYQQRQRINDWTFRPLPHLRFVSISYIDDEELPPSLLDLHQLCILQLEGCSSLRMLHLDCLHLLRVLRLCDCGALTAVDVSMLSDLQTLELRNCPSVTLVNIGDLHSLQVVRLLSCPSLSEVKIGRTNRVQVLEMIGCQALEDVSVKCLTQLRILWLEECCMVKTLVFGSANHLQDLQLSECTALKYIDFEHLKHLQKLKIDACLSLVQVDVITLATSLQSLVVSGCPSLQIIGPDHLRTSPLSPPSSKKAITTLIQKLDLSDCGSLVIVDVGRLDHLQDLLLSDCPNLLVIRGITASKLQSLYYERVHPDLDRTLQKLCQTKGNKLLDCTVRYAGRTVQITDACMKKL